MVENWEEKELLSKLGREKEEENPSKLEPGENTLNWGKK